MVTNSVLRVIISNKKQMVGGETKFSLVVLLLLLKYKIINIYFLINLISKKDILTDLIWFFLRSSCSSNLFWFFLCFSVFEDEWWCRGFLRPWRHCRNFSGLVVIVVSIWNHWEVRNFRCQFHQHFKSSFCADILVPKT